MFIMVCIWIISLIRWVTKKIGFIGNAILFGIWLYLSTIILV